MLFSIGYFEYRMNLLLFAISIATIYRQRSSIAAATADILKKNDDRKTKQTALSGTKDG